MYNLPQSNLKEVKEKTIKTLKSKNFWGALVLIVVGCIIGVSSGMSALRYFPTQTKAFIDYFQIPQVEVSKTKQQASNVYTSSVSYEQSIINAAKNVSPSVVSIVISKNVPTYEEQWVNPFGDNSNDNSFGDLPFNFQIPQEVPNGTKYQEIGAGSGFIVSADGYVLTNKHVVSDSQADYTVFTNDGKKYPAKVLALDPVQDLAVIKIQSTGVKFKPAILGDSSGIQIGQTAIAIGNSLGQFNNTVSLGVVSGLQRTISASDQVGAYFQKLWRVLYKQMQQLMPVIPEDHY